MSKPRMYGTIAKTKPKAAGRYQKKQFDIKKKGRGKK